MEALRVDALSVVFGGVKALNNVSFSVQTGERLAIIGPNGAGKTTLFNAINGQHRVTSGQIYFFGQDISNLPTHRRAHLGQARSFQLISLFFNLSLLENTVLSLQGTKPSRFDMFRPLEGYKDEYIKAKEILGNLKLWENRHQPVKTISYGEQRRLELAISFALNPRMLLLDEPSNGLTGAESMEIVDMIRKLGSTVTVLMVAHDLELVFGVANRIIVLHYGEVIANGKPEDIRVNPRVKKVYTGIEGSTRDA